MLPTFGHEVLHESRSLRVVGVLPNRHPDLKKGNTNFDASPKTLKREIPPFQCPINPLSPAVC